VSWIKIGDVEVPISSIRIEGGQLRMTAMIAGPLPACKRPGIYTLIGDDGEVFGRGRCDEGWPKLRVCDTLSVPLTLNIKDKWIEEA
jgi:hypothetical protein